MKKTLSLFLSIAMLISMLSGLNLTAYAAVDTGSCGDSVRWSYNKSTNELIIIGTGEMYDYSYTYTSSDYNETPWDSYRDSIQKVTIKNGVTNIGSYAFYKCASLKSVTIPDSVTSIGGDAFWYCISLTSVTIPDGVISISDDTFCGCKSLTSVTIPDSVTSIGVCAFCGCKSLTDIAIPDSVTYIGTGAFDDTGMYYDSANWDGDVFYIGKYLLSANDTISGDYAVKDGTVLIAYGAFDSCVSLESITIPDSVKYMCGRAFHECQSLENVTIGDGLISIGDYAFYNCVSLTDVTLPDNIINLSLSAFFTTKMYDDPANWDDGVFYVGKHIADVNMYKVKKFKIREGVFYIPANAFFSCDFEEVIIPDGVISIGDSAFEECDELKSVIISDSVTTIGAKAFDLCWKLEDIYYTGSESEWNEISIGDKAISDDVTIHYNYHEHVNSFNYESEPTCTEEGMKHYTCDICGLEYTEVTSPALGHAFGNNNKTCSVCGEANPNYVEPSDNTPNNTPTNPSNNQNNQNNQPSAQAPAAQPSQDTTTKPAENNEKPQEVYLGKIPSGVAVKSQKKAIKVSWKKVKSAKGYQVQLATNSKFTKGQKTYSVKGANATSKIIKGLKSGKKYYLRVRSYKTVKGKTVYSKWSKAKSIKVK